MPKSCRYRWTITIGLLLVAVSWSASWSGRSPLAYHAFFPIWLGYVLVVDALVGFRSGSSLLTRSPRAFAALFICSIPFWWMFELLNLRLDNWRYELPYRYSWLAYHAEASLAFSTVIPAIFETAELWNSLVRRRLPLAGRRLDPPPLGWLSFSAAGLVMLLLVLGWPHRFFPLAWISLFFLVDPLVHLAGGRSIAANVATGGWRVVWLLFAAGITCGFFWEMWNARAMPKWTYDISYADSLHVFEMPLLGYGGYLPFALETYALVALVDRIVPFLPAGYLRFAGAERDA